jgi:hypothetical protein
MSEVAVAAASAAPSVGKPRKVLVIILLSIITLGIYGLVWIYKTFEEMKTYSGKGVGGWIGVLLDLVIPFLMASEVGKLYAADGKENPVSGWTGCWVLLPLIGGLVWLCKTQWALNRFWASKGATA